MITENSQNEMRERLKAALQERVRAMVDAIPEAKSLGLQVTDSAYNQSIVDVSTSTERQPFINLRLTFNGIYLDVCLDCIPKRYKPTEYNTQQEFKIMRDWKFGTFFCDLDERYPMQPETLAEALLEPVAGVFRKIGENP